MPKRIAVLTTQPAQKAFEYFRPYIVPNATGIPRWSDTEFVYNPENGSFDGLVVWQSVAPLERAFELTVPPTRTLLAIVEPPDILTLPDDYTRQFAGVLGPDPAVRTQHRFLRAGGHHWFAEIMGQEAIERPNRDKSRLLSAVVSAKIDTAGHRRRLVFMRGLSEHFGDRLDWFGRGIRDLGDRKLNALEDYRYHIVFENGSWPHYWTEKLSDAFISNCLPFYWGDPKAAEYFDPRSFVPVDLDDLQGTIRTIERAIGEDWWLERQGAIAESRRRVVQDFHPFRIWQECFAALPGSPPASVRIFPFDKYSFSLPQRFRFKWRKVVGR